MKTFFGANYNTLETILKKSYSDQMKWVKSVNDNSNNIIEPWKTDWLELAEGNYPYIYSTKDKSHSPWTLALYRLYQSGIIKIREVL